MKSYDKTTEELRRMFRKCDHSKLCIYYDPPRGRFHICVECLRTLIHDRAGNFVIDDNDITLYRETVKSVLTGVNKP